MKNIEIQTKTQYTPRRLAIFQCHDKDGIIDDYIPYLLHDLLENLEMLVIVVNGKLTPEGRPKLEALTPHVFTRADEGFDAAAWKEAMIEYLGWEKVAEFDELILLNDTFFGPFYPFKEVFAEMDQRPVDFWGLTAHAATEVHDYWPTHIQSYFIVVRKRMFSSYEFQQYWECQPTFKTRDELINRNELVFTKRFADAGFCWDTFVDTNDIDEPAINHYMLNTLELIRNRKYPVIKRLNFGFAFSHHLNDTNGMQLGRCLEYIQEVCGYDTSLIYQNIIRTYNVADIFNNLHLNYILPKFYKTPRPVSSKRIALVFHISYMDMLDYLRQYLQNVPERVDVILTTKPQKNVDVVYNFFSPILGDRLLVLRASDPGRDLSALLVTAAPYLSEYDYICFCHDKRSHKNVPVTVGAGFQECLIENMIGSGPYIENVLSLLDMHPEIGLLVPPPPNHSEFFSCVLANPWTVCFEAVKELAKRLHLEANIARDKPPLAIGTAFWCRRDALVPLLDYPWKLKDFPREPLPDDGTLNHALERIFPFVAQHQGYLTGWVMTDEYASLEINNIHYRLDQVLHSVRQENIAQGSIAQENVVAVNQIGVKGALVIYIKKHLPKPFWGIARKIKHLLSW